MQRFTLLTGALVLVLAAFVTLLPSTDLYTPGVDDGPPQQFKTIADAEKAAGFDFPDAGLPRGWKLEGLTVTPAYYYRRFLGDNPQLIARPMPNQGNNPAPRLWRYIPDPPPGVHSYVAFAYVTDSGTFIGMNVNYPVSNRGASVPSSDAKLKSRRTVSIGGEQATLTTFESRDIETMYVAWHVRDIPVSATSFNLTRNDSNRFTVDDFIAFMATVR